MQRRKKDHRKPYPKIINLENLGPSECQHRHSHKLCQRNPCEHLQLDPTQKRHTEDPTETSAPQARSSRSVDFPIRVVTCDTAAGEGTVKLFEICAQNSTPIPAQMTRLTRLMAFKFTPHRTITPATSTTIIPTVNVNNTAVVKLPNRIAVTRQITANADPSNVNVSETSEMYWSKKI